MYSQWIRIGWRLLRPPTLTASITPVLVGTGLALQTHALRVGPFIAMLIASMLIQAAANMLNEYYDFRRGLDNKEMVGIAGTIVRDQVRPSIVLLITIITLLISLLLGIYIAATSSWWVALAGVLSMSFLYLYSAGPHPISYTPFGEMTSGILMGPVIILITYFIQTSTLTASAVVASIPIGLLIGNILLANNIRDIEHDHVGGRRTLPIVLGRTGGIRVLGAVFAAAFAILILVVIFARVTPWALLAFLVVPVAAGVPRKFLTAQSSDDLQDAFKRTSATLIGFGFLMFIGLVIGR